LDAPRASVTRVAITFYDFAKHTSHRGIEKLMRSSLTIIDEAKVLAQRAAATG